jgi:hypothetical protein
LDASGCGVSNQEQRLEAILRDRGLEWAITLFPRGSNAAAHYLDALRRLTDYVKAHRRGEVEFTPEFLESLASVSPHKADAFLQALVSIRSTPMLCAAWRILQGMEVERVEMRYVRLTEFALHVTLRSPYSETEEYITDDVNDIAFVRHLGKAMVDGRPLFDGFYALRQT